MLRELTQLVVFALFLVGLVLFLVVGMVVAMHNPVHSCRLVLLSYFFLFHVAGAVILGGAAFVFQIYALARGRRDRSDGISCAACGRRAFPVEGTTSIYKCAICQSCFEGPGHLN